MVHCRLLGHRLRFTANGATMHWRCDRDCGESGSKRYADVEQAARYAAAFDRRDADDLGRRTPIGLLPLRLLKRGRRSR